MVRDWPYLTEIYDLFVGGKQLAQSFEYKTKTVPAGTFLKEYLLEGAPFLPLYSDMLQPVAILGIFRSVQFGPKRGT